ncbi:MAG: ASKHA domain-containing protein [Promethearchaeota archaeon]
MVNERVTLIIEPISKRINISTCSTAYEAILALNFPIGALCAGKGTCGKCIIRILDPNAKLSEPSKKEIKLLGNSKLSKGYRLACQTKIHGDSRIFLTEALIPKGNQILVDADLKVLGIEHDKEPWPVIAVKSYSINFSNLRNTKNLLSEFVNAIENGEDEFNIFKDYNPCHVNNSLYNVIKKIPLLLREKSGVITVFYRRTFETSKDNNWKIFDIDSGKNSRTIFGLAIDIGTTTIVGYLINLISGQISSISAILNPQVAIGEDLISRLTYIIKNNNNEKAKKLIINGINNIIENCCKKAKISLSDIKDITIVGNTGMHHMFFGIPIEFLAVSPYVPVFKAPINLSANTLGLNCNPNTNVYSPPVIASYVGTDTIGCIISSKIYTFEKYTLLVDIGTNGELVIGNKNGLCTCSCAAGSALEGAHISSGMRASEGAIESVFIDKETLEPSLKVIGNTNPLGICGSGLIDAVAEMLKSKIITRAGKFNLKSDEIKNHPRIAKRENLYCYILYKPEWDNHFQDDIAKSSSNEIIITQKDINQLQLAKGAFLSAAYLLIKLDNKNQTSLEQVLLAGGFGTFINKKNAAFIGLFPEVKSENVFQIGNSAGIGAQLLLRDFKQRKLANEIAFNIKYYEIASLPIFQKEFTASLYFPHYDLENFPSIKEQYKDLPLM